MSPLFIACAMFGIFVFLILNAARLTWKAWAERLNPRQQNTVQLSDIVLNGAAAFAIAMIAYVASL